MIERYPHLARYLAGLPNGLASHPDCLVKTEVHGPALSAFPQLAGLPELPMELGRFVRGEHDGQWMPEVVAGAASMLVRDEVYATDDELLAWRHREMVQLFSKPTYRIMMFLLSPTLIIMNATRRWGSFHTGSTLSTAAVKKDGKRFSARASLEFPSGVFNDLFARLVGTTYQAALDCCRAPNPRVWVENLTPTSVEFATTWGE